MLEIFVLKFYLNLLIRCLSGPYCQTYLQGRITSATTFLSTAPTTDGRQTSSPTDTVAVTATNEPQSTVGSGDTPANTTNNQELPAAGTDQTTEGNPCNLLLKGEMAVIDFYV